MDTGRSRVNSKPIVWEFGPRSPALPPPGGRTNEDRDGWPTHSQIRALLSRNPVRPKPTPSLKWNDVPLGQVQCRMEKDHLWGRSQLGTTARMMIRSGLPRSSQTPDNTQPDQ